MTSTKPPMLGLTGLELERLIIEPHGVSLFVRTTTSRAVTALCVATDL
jgi:hypothetical protein